MDVLVRRMRISVGGLFAAFLVLFQCDVRPGTCEKGKHTPERAAVRDRAHSSQRDWIEMRPSGGDTSPPDRKPPHV